MRHRGIRGRARLSTLANRRVLVAAAAVGCLSIGLAAAPVAAAAAPNPKFLLPLALLEGLHYCVDRPCQWGRESLWHRRCTSDRRKARGG